MLHFPAFLAGLFPKLFSRAEAVVEPAGLRDAPQLSQLHRASFHRGWGTNEFEQILIERNALAHRLRLGGSTIGFIVSRIAAFPATCCEHISGIWRDAA